VLVLNGVNLGRLGSREPLVYGSTTHEQLAALCVQTGNELGLDVEVRQTDDEAEMVRWLHEAADAGAPVVLNSAAWSHYSYALRDACSQLTAPLVEVHISQVHAARSSGTPASSARWRQRPSPGSASRATGRRCATWPCERGLRAGPPRRRSGCPGGCSSERR
jgi:3-dehydroquinate dehydratase-2